MDEPKKILLLDLIIHRVIELRKPVYGKAPFHINIEQLEVNPRIRHLMLTALRNAVGALNEIEAIAGCPEGCRAFAALFAHECRLPFILPVELNTDEHAPLGMYGSVSLPARILLIQEYAKNAKPILRMMNALQAQRYKVSRVVTVFDALDKREGSPVHPGAVNPSPLAFMSMHDVLHALKSDPTFFGIDAKLAHACYRHYEQMDSRSIPPSPPRTPSSD